MLARIPLIDGYEFDLLTKGGKRVHTPAKAGTRAYVKRRYRKRLRRTLRVAVANPGGDS